MSTESAPSFRTEAFNLAVAELAQFPDAHAAVLKKLEVGIQAIKSQPKSSGNTTALKGYQEAYAAFGKGRRMGSALVHLYLPPPPSPVELPATILGSIRAIAGGVAPTPEPEEELDLSGIMTEADTAASALSRRHAQSITNLANKLGETLEGRSKENSADFFILTSKRLDPFTKLDAEPRVLTPFDLVPDGEGEDFTPGRLILIVTSYNVYVDGVFVKRDYRLNGKPAVQSHPDIIRLDGNIKIRSTKKKIDGKEFAFYAKALWVREGDALYGYLNFNQASEDDKRFGRHYQVVGGMLVPRE